MLSRMSRTGGSYVAVAMRDCSTSLTSSTSYPCKHHFLSSWSIRCAIKASDPSGLDSRQWIPQARCCKNHTRASALAVFLYQLSFTDPNPAPLGLTQYDRKKKILQNPPTFVLNNKVTFVVILVPHICQVNIVVPVYYTESINSSGAWQMCLRRCTRQNQRRVLESDYISGEWMILC